MHLFDPSVNFACTGIVGGGIPHAVGAGLAYKKLGNGAVAVAEFGEGASNQGSFHEALNMAGLWKLPCMFVCQDNNYGISVNKANSTAVASVADRAASYGMPGVRVTENDPDLIFAAVGEAVARARRGEGPTLLEVKVDRLYGHFQGDPETYRPKGEVESLRRKDSLAAYEARLKADGVGDRCGADGDSRPRQGARRGRHRIRQAKRLPGRSGGVPARVPGVCVMTDVKIRNKPLFQAMVEGIQQEMERDPRVICMGEDVGKMGGVFQSTAGLHKKFPDRVLDTPISETAIMGAALGAAASGLRPIAELMFVDFMGVCFGQIMNEIGKATYMSGGAVRLPLVITASTGGGFSDAAQHSQTLHGLFAHVPGLKVVAPSNPHDAKGLMITAIRDDNPVVYLFHKAMLGLPVLGYVDVSIDDNVPAEPYTVPFGKARIVREGTDVTIVGFSQTVQKAAIAADRLAARGISAEVIDPRTLVPLDAEAIVASVKKTGRLLVVDEDYLNFGMTGEISALIAERLDEIKLRAPIRRLGVAGVSIPYSPALEKVVIPQVDHVIEAAERLVAGRVL